MKTSHATDIAHHGFVDSLAHKLHSQSSRRARRADVLSYL